MPEPTPVDGIDIMPRVEIPSEVIVTTESRTEATTVGRSAAAVGAAFPVKVERPAAAGVVAEPVGEPSRVPTTRAAVPPAAMTADSSAAARIVVEPPIAPSVAARRPGGLGWREGPASWRPVGRSRVGE